MVMDELKNQIANEAEVRRKKRQQQWIQLILVHLLILCIQVGVIFTGFEAGCFPAWASEMQTQAYFVSDAENVSANGYYSPESRFDLYVHYVNHEEEEGPGNSDENTVPDENAALGENAFDDANYVNQIILLKRQPLMQGGKLRFLRTDVLPGTLVYPEIDEDGNLEYVYEGMDCRQLQNSVYVAFGDSEEFDLERGVVRSYLKPETPMFDETAPDIARIILIPEDESDDGSFCRSYRIDAVAADEEAGMEEAAWSLDGDHFSALSDFTITENGTYRLWAVDQVGNRSSEIFVVSKIDDVSPIIGDIHVNDTNYVNHYGRSANVMVEAEDEKAGLAEEAFSFDEGENWQAENSTTVSANGVLKIAVRDQCKNVSYVNCNVDCIDDEGPSLIVSGNPTGKVNGDVTLTVSARDSKAGIASLAYRNDAISTRTPIGSYDNCAFVRETVTISLNGSYTFFASDGLGNSSSQTIRITAIDRKKKTSSSSVTIGARKKNDNSPQAEPIIIEGKKLSGDMQQSEQEIVLQSDRRTNDRDVVTRELSPKGMNAEFDLSGGLFTDEYPLDDSEQIGSSEEDDSQQLPDEDETAVITDEVQLPENNAAPDIVYPTVEQKDSHNPLFLFAILTVLTLLLVVGFLLFRKGILKLPAELFQEKDDKSR